MITPVRQHQALVRDILDGSALPGFRLWWLGQSGFALQWERRLALLDPYLSDSLTVKYANTDKPHVRMTALCVQPEPLASLGLCLVTASHHHTDHLDGDTLRPIFRQETARWPAVRLVVPEAWRALAAERSGRAQNEIDGMDDGTVLQTSGFTITAIASAHETIERDERGHCRFLGYVIQFGGRTVYHSGDTVLYDGMVERLRPFNVDVAILPINGADPRRRVPGNLDGRQAAWLGREIGARVVIPCHYEMFEFNTASPDDFADECRRMGQACRLLRCGERFDSMEIER